MQAIVSHTLASHLFCGLLGRVKELMESGLTKGERFEVPRAAHAGIWRQPSRLLFRRRVAGAPADHLLSDPHRASARPEATCPRAPVGRWGAHGRVERAPGSRPEQGASPLSPDAPAPLTAVVGPCRALAGPTPLASHPLLSPHVCLETPPPPPRSPGKERE